MVKKINFMPAKTNTDRHMKTSFVHFHFVYFLFLSQNSFFFLQFDFSFKNKLKKTLKPTCFPFLSEKQVNHRPASHTFGQWDACSAGTAAWCLPWVPARLLLETSALFKCWWQGDVSSTGYSIGYICCMIETWERITCSKEGQVRWNWFPNIFYLCQQLAGSFMQ